MTPLMREGRQKRRGGLLIIVAAVLIFNNWLLGFALNPSVIFAGGTISQLSASTQPWHWVFRSLDIFAGLLLIIAAYVAYKIVRRGRDLSLIIWSSAALGASNILDAFLPLDCASTVDKHCIVYGSPVHHTLPLHVISTVLIAISLVTVPLGIIMYVKSKGSRLLSRVLLRLCYLSLVLSFISYLTAVVSYYSASNPVNNFISSTQMAQMLVFALCYVFWFIEAGLYPTKVLRQVYNTSKIF